jgi:hypothetical protein
MVAMKFKRPKASETQKPDGLIVGTGGLSRYPKISLPKLSKKQVLIALVAVVVIGLGLLVILSMRKPADTSRTVVCTERVADAAIEQAVTEMQQKEGFDRDPSCLYVLVNYYIARGDPENARKYFDKFEAIYNTGEVLKTAPITGRKDPIVLKTQIEFLETRSEQTRKNAEKNGPLWTE